MCLRHALKGVSTLVLAGDDLLGLREPLLSLQTQLRRVVSSRNPFAMKVSSDHPLRRTLQETRNLLDEIL